MQLKKWSVCLSLCFGVFIALASFKFFQIKAAIAFGESFPEHSESVEIFTATMADYQPQFTTLGEVIAKKQLNISNELPGRIVSVNFTSGSEVEKNQVLLQQDIATEKANLAAAQARLQLASNSYRRLQDLYKKNAVSQEAVDTARAEEASQKADIEALKSTIDKKTLKAPFAAQAGLHEFEVGQYLQANTMITTLIGDSDTLWVDFKIPQFYPILANNSRVKIRRLQSASSALAAIPASSNESYTARVLASDTVINNANRSRHYRAEIKKSEFPVSPHAIVEVEIPLANKQSMIAIPATAIQNDHLGQFVYKLIATKDANEQPAFRAERAQIAVLAQQQQQVFISSGLKANDVIAAAGAFKLHPGILTYARERKKSVRDSNIEQQQDIQ